MVANSVVEQVPVTSTDSRPIEYRFTITGKGSLEEVNRFVNYAMRTKKPQSEEEKQNVKQQTHGAKAKEICPKCGGSGMLYMGASDGEGRRCPRCKGEGQTSPC